MKRLSIVGISVGITLSLGLAAAQPPGALNLGVESPVVWRAFQPLVVAFGQGNAQRAVDYLRQGSAIVRKADAHLERDAATETFRKDAVESMEDFDLSGFYKLLPEQAGKFRSFSFAGSVAAKSYKVQAAKGETLEVNARSSRRGFGDSSGSVRMRSITDQDDDRYVVHLRGGVGLGALSWDAILLGLSDAARTFEAPAEQELPLVLRAADSFIKKTQPKLGARDRRILSGAWGSFPKVADLLLPLGHTDDLIADVDPAAGVTRVTIATRWNLKGMASKYPELAGYFEDLGDLAEAKLRLTDSSGNTLVELHSDTEHARTRIYAFLREGKLVPSREGKPLLDQTPRFEQMVAHFDFHFVLHRVHLYIDDMRIELNYREHAHGAELTARAKQVPKVRAKGAAFGVVPTGMLDWFIPGDIPSLTQRMLKVALRGNDGKGLVTIVRFEQADSGLATFDWSTEWEALDTPLVRFGMAIIADRVVPDEKQEEDIRRLAVDYRDAFDADLERFAKFGLAVK